MLFKVESKKTIDQVCQDLEKAVMAHKFGVMTIHNLKETMNKKGLNSSKSVESLRYVILNRQKKVLERKMDMSTALPCRISVYIEGR